MTLKDAIQAYPSDCVVSQEGVEWNGADLIAEHGNDESSMLDDNAGEYKLLPCDGCMFTTEQAGRILGIYPRTVRYWCAKLRITKRGRDHLLTSEQVREIDQKAPRKVGRNWG